MSAGAGTEEKDRTTVNEELTPRRAVPEHHRRNIWIIVVVAVVVVCGGGVGVAYGTGFWPFSSTAQNTPTPTPPSFGPRVIQTPTPTPPPVLEPLPTWPLTGVGGDVVDRPALVVKIENSSDARPQEGLESADIVYEEMVEGGISRFAAIFNSTLPPRIVPIRSVRPMDGPITAWTGGVLAFSGGQAQFTSRAQNDGLQLLSMDAGAKGFSRVSGRASTHDVAGDPAAFLAQADSSHQSPPPPFAAFDTDGSGSTAQRQGTMTSQVSVTISSIAHPSWSWDASSGRWLRSEGNTPAKDAAGDQLSASNVLVLGVQVQYLAGTDAAGNHIPESIVVGQGSGIVVSGQMSAPITWQKADESSPWQFLDATGAPVTLTPGNTWIELVPNSGTWSVS